MDQLPATKVRIKRFLRVVILAGGHKIKQTKSMSNQYGIETSFGEFSLDKLTTTEWDDIKSIAEHLIQCGEFKTEYQASIAAFIIWISEKEIMGAPRNPKSDCLH